MSFEWPSAARPRRPSAFRARRPWARRCWLSRQRVTWRTPASPSLAGEAPAPAQEAAEAEAGARAAAASMGTAEYRQSRRAKRSMDEPPKAQEGRLPETPQGLAPPFELRPSTCVDSSLWRL